MEGRLSHCLHFVIVCGRSHAEMAVYTYYETTTISQVIYIQILYRVDDAPSTTQYNTIINVGQLGAFSGLVLIRDLTCIGPLKNHIA